jgi:CO dehydrogenase/acetyl-CoA synthase gamma subunit (corrinoid Fe-S protein)
MGLILKKMYNNQTISVTKNYYDKHNCKFAFCESCYWFATILVNKFNNSNRCYICNKKDIHIGTILI